MDNAQALNDLADKVVIANATGNGDLYNGAVSDMLKAVRALATVSSEAQPVAISGEFIDALILAIGEMPCRDSQDGMNVTPGELIQCIRCIEERFAECGESILASPAPDVRPIDMILHCPKCGKQHVDEPEHHNIVVDGVVVDRLELWENPPHRSHLCHGCAHIWRPADVATNGVATIKTKGKADSPAPDVRPSVPSDERLAKELRTVSERLKSWGDDAQVLDGLSQTPDIMRAASKTVEKAVALLSGPASAQAESRPLSPTIDVRREALNRVCIDGHLNKALDDVMASNSPDGTFNILGVLAGAAIDIALSLATSPASVPAPDSEDTPEFDKGWPAGLAAATGPEMESPSVSDEFIDSLIQRICELPDRSSPENDPDAMVCTPEELRNAIRSTEEEFAEIAQSAAPVQPANRPEWQKDLIQLLISIRPQFGAVGSRDVDVRRQQEQIDAAISILTRCDTSNKEEDLPEDVVIALDAADRLISWGEFDSNTFPDKTRFIDRIEIIQKRYKAQFNSITQTKRATSSNDAAQPAEPVQQEPVAAQPQDERAAFEKAMNDARFFPAELSFARMASPSGRDEYANSHLQSCWIGWQARAAQPVQDKPQAYAGDNFEKLASEMREAANAAVINGQPSVALFVRQWADRVTDLSRQSAQPQEAEQARELTDERIDGLADRFDLYGIQDGGRVDADTLRNFTRAALAQAAPAVPDEAPSVAMQKAFQERFLHPKNYSQPQLDIYAAKRRGFYAGWSAAQTTPEDVNKKPLGWVKSRELETARESGGSVNLWLHCYSDTDMPIYAAAPSAPSVSADKPAAANAGCQDVMAQLEKWEPSIIDLSDAICEFETELYVPERGMLKAFRHLLDCYPWARPTATSASESADPLQFLADQAQELDMGYGPNACPTCLRSGSGEAGGHMDIDREGARFWHRDCANHLGGVMREIKREPDKSLLECQHCGKCGYYPVGGVGRICAAIAAQSKQGGAA